MKTRNSIWRALVAVAVAAIAVFLLPSAAQAQGTAPLSCEFDIGDYEGTAILSVNPTVIAPGGTVTITGSGWPPNSMVPLSVNGVVIAQPVTDPAGNFSIDWTLPPEIGPGVLTISALCGAFTLSTELTVSGGGPPGALPATGADHTTELLQLALVLLVCGALLVFLARRQARRREARASVGAV